MTGGRPQRHTGQTTRQLEVDHKWSLQVSDALLHGGLDSSRHVLCIMYHVKAFTVCVVPVLCLLNFRLQMSVLRIRDILAQIRILGSVTLTNGP